MTLIFDKFLLKKDGLDLRDSLWIITEIRSKMPFLSKMLPVSNWIIFQPFRVESKVYLDLFLHVLM
jgi:hypothetical protein